MKKKLEAELISIAHRILKLKNKSDLIQLHQETQQLYEKLSVLRFVEENFAEVKPTIGYAEIEDKLALIFDAEIPAEVAKEDMPEEPILGAAESSAAKAEIPTEPIATVESQETNVGDEIGKSGKTIADLIKGVRDNLQEKAAEETVAEAETEAREAVAKETMVDPESQETPEPVAEMPVADEPIRDAAKSSEAETEAAVKGDFFKPAFELSFEPKTQESKPTETSEPNITPAQISFNELLGQSYVDPVFVKPEELQKEAETGDTNPKSDVIPITRDFNDTSNVISINKSDNLNDRISKGITIGLNDRVAFMNHLFNNSSEDYNRVLSQLITLDTFGEAKNFIDTMVKPDYNHWEGKEEYEQRFMEIIEKKFS